MNFGGGVWLTPSPLAEPPSSCQNGLTPAWAGTVSSSTANNATTRHEPRTRPLRSDPPRISIATGQCRHATQGRRRDGRPNIAGTVRRRLARDRHETGGRDNEAARVGPGGSSRRVAVAPAGRYRDRAGAGIGTNTACTEQAGSITTVLALGRVQSVSKPASTKPGSAAQTRTIRCRG